MKTLIYVGAHTEVDVPDAGIFATRGEPVQIEDDKVAARLLKQSTWKDASPETPAQRKARAQAEKDQAEQEKAAAAAVAKVKAEQDAAAKKAGS